MTLEWIENYMKKAEGLVYQDRIDEALAILNDLLYEEPGYAKLHNLIGWVYLYYANEPARAETHFQTAMKFDPTYAPPYLHLGWIYLSRGVYVEALGYLEQGSVKADANKVAFMECIGQAYELRGNIRKAIESYRMAMNASIDNREFTRLRDSIKRCRKKRRVLLIAF
jgi:tetratricopeptide (TPR) repeat protein